MFMIGLWHLGVDQLLILGVMSPSPLMLHLPGTYDLLDAIAKIQRFVSDVDFEAFENDEKLIDAVIHNLTVIGEAVNHVPSEITGRHPEIPWRQMVDLRNFSVHAYWNLRPSVIWDTIQNDLPPLVEPLRILLRDAEG
jgi:uncharacterized protein with HEPN domain